MLSSFDLGLKQTTELIYLSEIFYPESSFFPSILFTLMLLSFVENSQFWVLQLWIQSLHKTYIMKTWSK